MLYLKESRRNEDLRIKEMSTCADEADGGPIHMQEALSPVEDPVSPASSSLSNHNQNENEQVLLATMQPVNVLDLHESSQHTLHHKFHRHHHHHQQQHQHQHHPHHTHHSHSHHQHHHHSHHHHQQHQQDQDQESRADEEDDRVTPESAGTAVTPPSTLGEHKMIDLIYNDGQKTVMYTHDKEIIYENEADRVQVVEYPPPPPSPPSSSRSRSTTLHLHHYPQLQLQQHDDSIMSRGTPCTSATAPHCATTTTVLVLSELVAADPGATQLTLGPASSLRAGRRSCADEDSGGAEEVQGQEQGFVSGGSGGREEEEDLQGGEESQSLQTGDGDSAEAEVHKRVAVQVPVQAMESDSWRVIGTSEHPLTAATAAMLNLQHQVASGQIENPSIAYVNEYYRLQEKAPDDKIRKMENPGIAYVNEYYRLQDKAPDDKLRKIENPGIAYVNEYYKLQDKSQDDKLPPTQELWSTSVMGQKLLVQEPQGSGSSNRMESGPESAGSGELHHFLHQYNQSHSPGVQSLSGGLPLSPQSLQRHEAGSGGISGVKREPEDLSSSRGQQSSKRHKSQDSPTPPDDHGSMYHHHQHQHQLQVQQYGSPYDPYTSCSPRLQSAAYTSTASSGTSLQQEGTAVYVTGDTLPPLPSSGSSSLPTTTASYTRYEVVPSSYAVTHAIRSSSSSSKALTVDLPSPDSGIGADAVTPRQDHHPPPTALHQSSFDYTELCLGGPAAGAAVVLESGAVVHHQPLQLQLQQGHGQVQVQRGGNSGLVASAGSNPNAAQNPPRSRPWHDFGRQNDADKIQIPKIYSSYGFKYHLEAPISTSQRREDDRITYINKGQFYGIALDYIPDPDKPLIKSGQTVKSVVMLMFREEKSPEDEIKAWQFWHGRQHSVKQRILDADTKNSVGLVGCIEEIAHNAIAVYWNPVESSAKINVAVQCLSTDFSSQKGVKGLPLHIQVDTYEEPPPHTHSHTPPSHRGYCQIKVFCDKGAERKTRDEERRAAKRKMTATGRKKLDELYHSVTERSEFYSMVDLHKPPVLFSPPAEHTIDKFSTMELSGFYGGGGGGTTGGDTDTSSLSNGEGGGVKAGASSPYPTCGRPSLPALKFHNHFPPDNLSSLHDKKDSLLMQVQELQGSVLQGVQPSGLSPGVAVGNRLHLQQQHLRGSESEERVMLYVRQENEDVYTPLHVAPPSVQGLLNAIESKYKIASSSINNLYRKNTKGITAKIDDDMVRFYVDEDLFLLEVTHTPVPNTSDPNSEHDPSSPGDVRNAGSGEYDVTLIELSSSAPAPVPVSVSGPLSPHSHPHQHQHGHPHDSGNT